MERDHRGIEDKFRKDRLKAKQPKRLPMDEQRNLEARVRADIKRQRPK